MENAVLMTMILAAAAGFVAVIFSVRLERTRRASFFRYFSLQILFFNLLILTGLVWEYAGAQAAQTGPGDGPGLVPEYLLPLMSALKFVWVFTFVAMSRILLGETITRVFTTRFGFAAGILYVVHLASLFGIKDFAAVSVAVVEWPVVGTAYVTLLYVLLRSRGTAPENKSPIRQLGTIYLFTLTILVVSLAAGQTATPVRAEKLRLINAADMVLYNLLPLLWCVRYGRRESAVAALRKAPPEQLMEKYNISKREREVVALACAGKTNQEIADSLFISLQTVKDHVRSVFRKTKVRNRVEMVNLLGPRNSGRTGPE